jgi:hypothetical protein
MGPPSWRINLRGRASDDFGFVDLTTLPKTSFWQSAFGFQFGRTRLVCHWSRQPPLHDASPSSM